MQPFCALCSHLSTRKYCSVTEQATLLTRILHLGKTGNTAEPLEGGSEYEV